MAERRLLAGSDWPVRLIALFEALKGALALALGFGVIATLGESLTEAAQELVLGLHLDPSQPLPDAFIHAINGVRTGQIWIVVVSALAYSMVRFAEAYGLWNDRRWAAWVSALSGAVYLPIEAYELGKGLSWFRVAAALANVAIVAYMAMLLWQSRQGAASRDPDCVKHST